MARHSHSVITLKNVSKQLVTLIYNDTDRPLVNSVVEADKAGILYIKPNMSVDIEEDRLDEAQLIALKTKKLLLTSSVSSDTQYELGYAAGYAAGYSGAYTAGYNAGLSSGYVDGFAAGEALMYG